MTSQHSFRIHLTWEANEGGTIAEKGYSKNYNLKGDGIDSSILGSSAPAFMGSENRYNPENLLIGSLASCHMLWFLYLAKMANINVIHYKDEPNGILQLEGSQGRFIEITLMPQITITDQTRINDVKRLQEKAHEKCYIANSVNFPVKVEPNVIIQN
jgi:organic hydroperoxide reductase OsmC/OhrA